MSNSQTKVGGLIQELRNRRVFRVATVYLGSGFVTLEAADMILPRLGLPDWTVTFIMVLLGLGFPIALGLAWTFQFTPEGLKRSPKTGEEQSPDAKPLTGNLIIIVLLALILGVLVYPRVFETKAETYSSEASTLIQGSNSVAVLPFTPFNKTAEDQSFADGVHDDILTQLSKIAALKVISRTSVLQYQGSKMPLPEIARELGVENILEGSVRRAGDQIRIVAQLINAKTDEHVWAETYDRKYTDIFAIQSDVAQQIAKALKATLTPQEKEYIEAKPTDNQEAWELYIRGATLYIASVVNVDSVISIFNQAIQLDPNFLLPYTKLVRIHAYKYFDGTGTDPTPERLANARTTLDKAIAINSNAPETYLAQGYFFYYGSRDYERALEAFALAQESQPNNSDLFAATAYVNRRLGRWEEARENIEKAVSLDPNNVIKVKEARDTAFRMRDYSSTANYLERLSAIYSGKDVRVESMRYFLEFRRSANLEKMQTVLDQLLEKFDAAELLSLQMWQAYYSRDYKAGLELIKEDSTATNWLMAEWLRLNGKVDMARAYYDSARIELESKLKDNPENWSTCSDLGSAFSRLGKFEEAIKWGKKSVVLMPLSRDALIGSDALTFLMYIYLDSGYVYEALNLLEECLSIPGTLSVSELKLDNEYDSLRLNPRFQKLLQKYDI
ncbi:MAG: hypothetical protein HQ508_08405 [Candidatus Marinimicrobia bacterium]|nr:hypothetical protein [Candidatus Neomarinimicrobiota bacterium]